MRAGFQFAAFRQRDSGNRRLENVVVNDVEVKVKSRGGGNIRHIADRVSPVARQGSSGMFRKLVDRVTS